MEDIVIIGGGPIGLYCGVLASLHNLKGNLFASL
jgi:thioredoxin reductase